MADMDILLKLFLVMCGGFSLVCLPLFVMQLIETPHVLLVVAAIGVPGYFGAKALERALRPNPWRQRRCSRQT